jgi:hypothetical protein
MARGLRECGGQHRFPAPRTPPTRESPPPVTRFCVPGTVRLTPGIMVLYSCGKCTRRRTCAVLAPTQHENDEHNDDDEDYRPDTDIHRFSFPGSARRRLPMRFLAPSSRLAFDPATLT